MMSRFNVLLICLSLFVVKAKGQVTSDRRLHFSAAMGSIGTSTDVTNFLDQTVTRFEQSLDLIQAQILYRKSERITLWATYLNGYNPEPYLLAGFNRNQVGLYVGGKTNAGSYSATLQYGYQSFQDSLYQDNLWLEQAYQLANGITPKVSTWIGVGNKDRFEWIVLSSVLIPVAQQLAIEPLVLQAQNGFDGRSQTFFGVRAHVSLFERGQLRFGMSKGIMTHHDQTDRVLLFSGVLPFLKWHHLNLSMQKHVAGSHRSRILAIGMTLGFGRQN